MQSRETHNSQTLQQLFPEVYRDFFAKCQKVASAPNSFLWTGEFSGFYEGGLMISQKLPFRVYVGLESTFDKKVNIDTEYLSYEMDENKFSKRLLDINLLTQFQIFLTHFFRGNKNFTGLKVHILTESPLGHGLGSNGALAAALATLISKENKLENQFAIAKKILSASQKGYSSGVSAYNALIPTTEPILFFSRKKGFWAYSISEIIGAQKSISWPIDFGLIYSGVQTNSENVILATEHTLKELNETSQNINNLLKDYSHPPFQKTFLDMLNMTSGLMASRFAKIFATGANDIALEEFFTTLNQYQNLLHVLNISTKTSDIIYRRVHELANKEANGSGSGVKISGIGKGGVMLFALPYGSNRREIMEMVTKLRKSAKQNIRLDYASWLDGIGGEESKLEQDIESGKISPFLSQDVVLVELFSHQKRSNQVVTNERFSTLASETDVVLDKLSGKILIGGKSLTSKELPSQKATVLIMCDLLKSPGQRLGNNAISDSYGTNRYDLHSKIVLPLIKQVKELTKRDLQLSIIGGTYDNYTLKLDPSNISIAIAEKKL